jgi:hypothetical protein
VLQSASPFLFGLLLDRVGIGVVGLSAGLCLAAFGSLFLLRPRGAVAASHGRKVGEAKLNTTDRLSPRKWRALSAFIRSNNEVEQIVKSEGGAAL